MSFNNLPESLTVCRASFSGCRRTLVPLTWDPVHPSSKRPHFQDVIAFVQLDWGDTNMGAPDRDSRPQRLDEISATCPETLSPFPLKPTRPDGPPVRLTLEVWDALSVDQVG